MTILEAYLMLFADSFFNSLVLIPGEKFVADSMKLLGGFNIFVVATISSLAMIIANSVNYFCGVILYRIFNVVGSNHSNGLRLAGIFNKYLYFLNIFVYLPILGAFISLFSGYAKTSFRKFLVLISISITAYNFVYLLDLLK